MKNRAELLLLLVVLAAAAIFAAVARHSTNNRTADLSVTGVTVGMSSSEVVRRVGPPDMKGDICWTWFDGSRMDPRLVVAFDRTGTVTRVQGRSLQSEQRAVASRGDSPEAVRAALGQPVSESGSVYAYGHYQVQFQGARVASVIIER